MKLKDALINYRSEKLITQEQLSIESGISISTIIKLEKGEKPSTLTKAKIANYLGCKIEDLED